MDERETAKDVKRVFIVGARRSGTTWTMMLLARHPAVVALQQIDFFRHLAHFGSWWQKEEKYGLTIVHSAEGSRGGTPGSDGMLRRPTRSALEPERFHELVRPVAEHVYGRFADCKEDVRAIVDQEPENAAIWEEILGVFPDAYFLHVVRDPRSVCASQAKAAGSAWGEWHFSADAARTAREWCADVERTRAIRGATERFLEVRYEELRTEGPKELARIYRWLDLDAGPEQCAAAVDASSIDKLRGSGHGPKGFFRRGAVEGWREDLSTGDVRTVEYFARDLMREYGYAPAHPEAQGKPLRLSLRDGFSSFGGRLRRWTWAGAKNVPGLKRLAVKRLKKGR